LTTKLLRFSNIAVDPFITVAFALPYSLRMFVFEVRQSLLVAFPALQKVGRMPQADSPSFPVGNLTRVRLVTAISPFMRNGERLLLNSVFHPNRQINS
jgi:hypothetical protein